MNNNLVRRTIDEMRMKPLLPVSGNEREISLEAARALQPLFEGRDEDDRARLAALVARLMIDHLAGIDTDRARQNLGTLGGYAARSQVAPQSERAQFFGKG